MVSPLYHGRGCVVVSGSEVTHRHWLALMQGVWCRWLMNFQREPTWKLHHKFQHFRRDEVYFYKGVLFMVEYDNFCFEIVEAVKFQVMVEIC
ncbi:hypothetical protein V6N13_118049 [Hibiscus sabdariffa]